MTVNLNRTMRRIAPYLLLALLTAAFFWRVWTPNPLDRASFAAGDFSGQFYAFARYQAERLWSGQLPLWNPYVLAGHPFLADIQSAVFYPPRWLSIALSGPTGFTYFALEMEAIFHVFLASAFTFAFARRLFADDAAALVSALAFAFGGYLTSYPILQLAILETIVWLPLILLLIDHAVAGETRRRKNAATIGAGLVWGVSLLAGHPQTAMLIVYFALAFGVWRARAHLAGGKEIAARLVAFVAIGLGASAVQWIPSLEFMSLSTRGDLGYDALSGGFPLRDVFQMLLPGTTSLWSPLYVGVLPIVFAIVFGLNGRKKAEGFWLIAAGVAFLLSLGGTTFLYNLFYQWIPGFGLFRSQERAASLVSFALAIAAGGGLAALRASESDRLTAALNRALSWLAVGSIVLAVALFALWRLSVAPDVSYALDRTVFALLIVVAALAWLRMRQTAPGARWVWPAFAVGLIVFDLFSVNWQTNLEQRPPEAQATLPEFLAVARADPELVRVDGRGVLDGNWGNLADVQSTNGVSPLVIARYDQLRDALPKEREWELLNVRYVVSESDSLAVSADVVAHSSWQGRALNLFQLSDTAPRAWVVHRVRAMSDDLALATLADPAFDPTIEAIVADPISLGASSGQSSARVAEYAPERMVIDVDASAAGLLVVNELDYPGWRATLDGEDTPILRANVALRGVVVPLGQHRVEMVFQPATVWIGLSLSVLTWLALTAYVVRSLRRRPVREAA